MSKDISMWGAIIGVALLTSYNIYMTTRTQNELHETILLAAEEAGYKIGEVQAENMRRFDFIFRRIAQEDSKTVPMMSRVSTESDEDVALLISEYQKASTRVALTGLYSTFRAQGESVLDAWRHTLNAHVESMKSPQE